MLGAGPAHGGRGETPLPGARCVWGFSNTTFFHTRVEELPLGIDGQSYHPYGTGTRTFPKDEDHRDKPAMNVDGVTPTAEVRVPEGWAHTFMKTESLMRLLTPEARRHHPPGVTRFYHYMTEHGVAPPECGARDDSAAWRLKTLCALRSFCLWLNKGVDVLDYFCAYEVRATGMSLLPPDLMRLPPDSRFDDVATPPLKALRNLTKVFAGSKPLRDVRPLQVDVTPLDAPRPVFGKAVPLSDSDVFAFLPVQVSETRHVVAVYVSTYDATEPLTEERYRLNVRGLRGMGTTARLYDPVTDKSTSIELKGDGPGAADIQVSVVDYPRSLAQHGRQGERVRRRPQAGCLHAPLLGDGRSWGTARGEPPVGQCRFPVTTAAASRHLARPRPAA